MCNMCTNFTSGCGNNTALTTAATGTTSGCFCGCGQRVCRDACGNVWVRQNTSRCLRRCCNRCCNSWDNDTDTTNNGTAGNSDNGNGYACITVCGRVFNGATVQNTSAYSNNTDWYYARQYGLYPYGRRSFCCGSGFRSSDED